MISDSLVFQFSEHLQDVLRLFCGDRQDLQACFAWLKFVTDTYGDSTVEYLTKEPEHFEQLKQVTPYSVRSVADRIFLEYSSVGKVVQYAIENGNRAK